MHQRSSGREIFNRAVGQLSGLYPESEARSITHWLMEDLLHVTRVQIAIGGEVSASTDSFDRALERVAAGEPIQYVLGYVWFRGMKLEVGPGVLIPRPETELAVEVVLEDLPTASSILDIGTGSGCIAISVARERPDTEVSAWDISPVALAIAQRNAESASVSIEFRKVDVLEDWPAIGIDVIVSNPPYVLEEEKASMHQNVLGYEPQEALFVPDDDPLRFYEAIARRGRKVLSSKGSLVFEVNERLGRETAKLMEDLGYQNLEIRRDLFGKDRVVIGTR